MITLHHLENSRSFRILWLLEELGLEYKLVQHRRDPETSAAMADYKDLHPLGKAPILIDGDKILIESGAIMEYLIDHHSDGQLRPGTDDEERYRYNYWMHAAEGSVMNLITLALFLNRMESRAPFFVRPFIKPVTRAVRSGYVNPNLQKTLLYTEQELGRYAWFAGDMFSGADIMMSFVMMAMAARGGLDEQYPNCQRWVRQMEQRPAFQRAMEKNGEMRLLKD